MSEDTNRRFIASFLGAGGFGGRAESMREGVKKTLPSPDDVEKLGKRIAERARSDPAFGFVGDAAGAEFTARLHSAVDALRTQGLDARLGEGQRRALEAIVLLDGRPAIFIVNDTFELPEGDWQALAGYQDTMSRVFLSVGRIDIAIEYGGPYSGTGFMVGPDVVMTNRHVVFPDLVMKRPGGYDLLPGVNMSIDFKHEFGSNETRAFPIKDVIAIHEDPGIDAALLRIDLQDAKPPEPLRLQANSGFINKNGRVYTVGYPAADSERNNPTQMQRIFSGVYEKKRLAPGRMRNVDLAARTIDHDCTTLGGNSGSCLMDLDTNTVVGLHFQGEYLKGNTALVLADLRSDPMFASLEYHSGQYVPAAPAA